MAIWRVVRTWKSLGKWVMEELFELMRYSMWIESQKGCLKFLNNIRNSTAVFIAFSKILTYKEHQQIA
jgi:hypothetical protein